MSLRWRIPDSESAGSELPGMFWSERVSEPVVGVCEGWGLGDSALSSQLLAQPRGRGTLPAFLQPGVSPARAEIRRWIFKISCGWHGQCQQAWGCVSGPQCCLHPAVGSSAGTWGPQTEMRVQGDFLSSAGPSGSGLVLQQGRRGCGNQGAGTQAATRYCVLTRGQAGTFSQLLGYPLQPAGIRELSR